MAACVLRNRCCQSVALSKSLFRLHLAIARRRLYCLGHVCTRCQRASKRDRQSTHVMILSSSQLPTPRIVLVCGRQTATARFEETLQSTTQPLASPVSKRVLPRKKCTACICAVWPLKMYDGCAGGFSELCRRFGSAMMLVTKRS